MKKLFYMKIHYRAPLIMQFPKIFTYLLTDHSLHKAAGVAGIESEN